MGEEKTFGRMLPEPNMAAVPRYLHPTPGLLDADKAVFCQFVNYMGVGSDRESSIAHAQNDLYDCYIYDLEHAPYDVRQLSEYLMWTVDRRAIAASGSIVRKKTVLVRMPANPREMNEWTIKQVLDAGVDGLVFPHTENADQVIHAIRAMRYPQKPSAADFEPLGLRGYSPHVAAHYWGLSIWEYPHRADIWRLDPNGNMIAAFIIENVAGVENIRSIAAAIASLNCGAIIWAGGGDLMYSYGLDMDKLASGLDTIVDTAREFGIPVAINGTGDYLARYRQGVRLFVDITDRAVPLTPSQRAELQR